MHCRILRTGMGWKTRMLVVCTATPSICLHVCRLCLFNLLEDALPGNTKQECTRCCCTCSLEHDLPTTLMACKNHLRHALHFGVFGMWSMFKFGTTKYLHCSQIGGELQANGLLKYHNWGRCMPFSLCVGGGGGRDAGSLTLTFFTSEIFQSALQPNWRWITS